MSDTKNTEGKRVRETLVGRSLLLLFGLAVLSFLIAVDRAEWFAIRPATGTSIALSNAAASAPQQTPENGTSANP